MIPRKHRAENYVGLASLAENASAHYVPWARAPLSSDRASQICEMMVTDVTYAVQCDQQAFPELFIYGVTRDAHSVAIRVRDFYPYMFVSLPKNADPVAAFVKLEKELAKQFATQRHNKLPEGQCYVCSVELVQRQPLMGYLSTCCDMWKVTLALPAHIRTARNLFAHGIIVEKQRCKTFEANVPFVLRFMIDADFGGCQWIRWLYADRLYGADRKTRCQLELRTSHKMIKALPTDEYSDIGPMRWLSFDIECTKRDGIGANTQPHEDSVTQIACCLRDHGNPTELDHVVFCLLPDSIGRRKNKNPSVKTPLEESKIRVLTFKDERKLFAAFADYINLTDPDIFTGYNIDGFDWNYLFERAKALGYPCLKKFQDFSRIVGRKCRAKPAQFQSAAHGARKDYELICEGRWDFDMYKYITRGTKLRSYTLNAVAKHFLGDTKVEMPYSKIPEYQNGTDEQRAHLAYYCWKDAYLCFRLLDNRMAAFNSVEQARVTGVPMKFLLSRGQQIKTLSNLIRLAKKRNIVIPSKTESANAEHTQGATVLEPTRGLHKNPISTLDFKSLYPSIMRAFNICYSTKLSVLQATQLISDGKLTWDDINRVPLKNASYCFVKHHIRQGLLPEMEEDLMACRDRAKKDLKAEKDPQKRAVYDGRQLAIKIMCNSVYGFVKANMVCDKDLMKAVAAYGREMIDQTKKLVESTYTKANGHKYDARVIYGDTDSVMVDFGPHSVADVIPIAIEAAKLCTKAMVAPNELEYEKTYCPYLLIGKKKYAGRKYEFDPSKSKLAVSGLETVRRDNALIASETLERCLKLVLMDDSVPGAIEMVKEVIRDLELGRVDISKLIITKKISKMKYDSGPQIHVELAKKIAARADKTGEVAPQIGDRVKYVRIPTTKAHKAFESAEDPLYVLKHGMPVDVEYYIMKQLMKPIVRIMTPILAPKELTYRYDDNGERKDINDAAWQKLTAFKLLFSGEHRRHKVQRVADNVGIMRFAKRASQCLGCGVRLHVRVSEALCASCEPTRVI